MTSHVILAAGLGSRLKKGPKVILKEDGLFDVLANHIKGGEYIGAEEFAFVIGHEKDKVIEQIMTRRLTRLPIKLVHNNHYHDKENGYSAYLGLKHARETSVLVMGDHLLPYKHLKEDIERAKELLTEGYELIEIIDRSMKTMRPGECTKLLIKGDMIVDSGKTLEKFNALDAGLFVLNTRKVLKRSKKLIEGDKTNWNDLVVEVIRDEKASFVEMGGHPWFGINTIEQLGKAKKLLSNGYHKFFFKNV